jgi:hypothetical protein
MCSQNKPNCLAIHIFLNPSPSIHLTKTLSLFSHGNPQFPLPEARADPGVVGFAFVKIS